MAERMNDNGAKRTAISLSYLKSMSGKSPLEDICSTHGLGLTA
jgi:hypothetical protein